MWIPAVLVFVGGGFGAVGREFFMLLLQSKGGAFPLDIFAANCLASALLGFIFGLRRGQQISDDAVLLLGTGFTGGMSTFSSFIFGAYSVGATPGSLGIAIFYVVSSILAGYGSTWFGLRSAARVRGV